jgi:hypothetical protein
MKPHRGLSLFNGAGSNSEHNLIYNAWDRTALHDGSVQVAGRVLVTTRPAAIRSAQRSRFSAMAKASAARTLIDIIREDALRRRDQLASSRFASSVILS